MVRWSPRVWGLGTRAYVVVDDDVAGVDCGGLFAGGNAVAGFCVTFGPSTPLFGSGAAAGMPFCAGVCAALCGGCVIAGGAF